MRQRFFPVVFPVVLAAWFAACTVNPVPTPASTGGFTFGPGQLDGGKATTSDAGPDATGGDGLTGACDPCPPSDDGEAALADAADASVQDTTFQDSEVAADIPDAPPVVDVKPDVPPDTKTDVKTDTKLDTKDTTPDTPPPPPTFAAVYVGVIQKYSCGSTLCHGSKGKPSLFSSQDASYANLIGGSGGATYDCGGKTYVVAGDPKASLLWQKVAPGVAACGDKMPVVVDGDGIEQEDADLVAAWIAAGALP